MKVKVKVERRVLSLYLYINITSNLACGPKGEVGDGFESTSPEPPLADLPNVSDGPVEWREEWWWENPDGGCRPIADMVFVGERLGQCSG
jgi:hypothetical protein